MFGVQLDGAPSGCRSGVARGRSDVRSEGRLADRSEMGAPGLDVEEQLVQLGPFFARKPMWRVPSLSEAPSLVQTQVLDVGAKFWTTLARLGHSRATPPPPDKQQTEKSTSVWDFLELILGTRTRTRERTRDKYIKQGRAPCGHVHSHPHIISVVSALASDLFFPPRRCDVLSCACGLLSARTIDSARG